jgi:Fe-S-cluster-containing dehydrogenase component
MVDYNKSIECQICMNDFPIDVFKFLPCMHSLCEFCYNNIKKLECPYCKYSFSDELTEELEEELFKELEICDEPVTKREKKKLNKKKKYLFELKDNNLRRRTSNRFELIDE